MAKDSDCTVSKLMSDKTLRDRIDIHRYITDEVGIPTLTDIMKELAKPGLDPRESLHAFHFDSSIHTIDDLIEGSILPGIVTNVTDFGAFVDIGIKTNGLVHRSQLADRFVARPLDVVSVHQHVMVKVIGIDMQRGRIALSMKGVDQTMG
jgi:uncharacterized protein